MPAQAEPERLDWREWPEEKKRLLRARLLERRQRPWREIARAEQLPPAGDWYVWFLVGGRGAGKTRSGAEWLAEELRAGCVMDERYQTGPSTLSVRLAVWAISRGWDLRIGIDRARPKGQRVSATVGPVTCFGRTAGEAVDELAGRLAAEEGFVDAHQVEAA